MSKPLDVIALLDMDGTVADLEKALTEGLSKIASPQEPVIEAKDLFRHREPKWLKARKELIMALDRFWEDIPKLQLGFDVLSELRVRGFRVMVLTQGPRSNTAAWGVKVRWCQKHLPKDIQVTVTRDKGLVYGRVLVDDYPKYIERWLEHRPRGVVIMPANAGNEGYSHRGVLRYDGRNINEVREVLDWARNRDSGEEDNYPSILEVNEQE